MGIFTKKNAKRKSDDADEISDSWLMGEEDDENVSLDRLDYLENVGSNPPPSPDELISAPPPAAPIAADTAKPEPSQEGWHLPDMQELPAIQEPSAVEHPPAVEQPPTAEQLPAAEPPHDRRADDEQPLPISPPVAPVPISEIEAKADFLAVDIPDASDLPVQIPDAASVPLAEVPPVESTSFELPTPESSQIEPGSPAPPSFDPPAFSVPTVELPGSESDESELADSNPSTEPTGPSGSQAETLLEILGLEPGSSWPEIRDAHQRLMRDHDESSETDPSRVALGRAIKREMNTAYAALRLMAVD